MKEYSIRINDAVFSFSASEMLLILYSMYDNERTNNAVYEKDFDSAKIKVEQVLESFSSISNLGEEVRKESPSWHKRCEA